MANESMISLNVNLGSTKNVTAEFNSLIKTLESKKIKLDIDTTSLQASLKLASSEIEKSYSKIKDTVKKANNEISKPIASNTGGLSELEKQISNAEKAINKFSDTKNRQLNNLLAGNNGVMIPNLAEYNTLVSKLSELKTMQLDSTNVTTYASKIKGVQEAYDSLTVKIKQVNSTAREMNASTKIDSDVINKVKNYNTQLDIMRQKNTNIINNPVYQQIANDVNKLSQAKQPLSQLSTEVNKIDNNMKQLRSSMTQVGGMGGIFSNLGNSIKSAFNFMSASMVMYKIANQIREMPSEIIKLDTALVDLKKTTSMNSDELERFYRTSNETAKALGVSTEEIINQASAWSRLGYSTKEQAETMAEVSAIFKSISPDMDIDTATDGLVSVMKAFNIEANDALDGIASKINIIGNTQAVNNTDIVDFLTRSSSAMAEANNTLEETIALGTAATEITRDAASVGNVLKTTSMRIRGYDEETESYTADVEILDGTIANLTKTVSNAGGLSLFTDETKTTYKSTYQILEEINEIYDQLTDKNQAELLEALAGKRNGQALAAIINNFDAAKSSMESMADSQGNAMEEMEIIYESLEYKINRLKETWVGLAQGFIERDTFKGLVDGVTNILNFIDACGGLEAIVLSVIASMVALKVATASINTGSVVSGIQSVIAAFTARKVITDANTVSTLALSAAEKTLIAGVVVAGILAVGASINYIANSAERAEKRIVGLRKEITDLKANNQNVTELSKRYDELSTAVELSVEEQQELVDIQNKLKEQMPEISGYYDESGNFLITNTEQIKENIKATEDLIDKRRELLGEKQSSRIGFTIDDINQYTVLSEELTNYMELKDKLFNMGMNSVYSTNEDLTGVGFSQEDIDLLNRLDVVYGSVENAQEDLANSTKEMADSIADLRQQYSDAIAGTDSYKTLTDSQKNQLSDAIKGMTKEELMAIENEITNSTDDYVKSFQFSMEQVSMAAKESAGRSIKSFKEMIDGLEDVADSSDILSIALEEFRSKGNLTEETLKELNEQYPKIFDGCNTAGQGVAALNKQLEANKLGDTIGQLNDATDKISSLSSVLDDLKENNSLTSKSFKTLSSEFPDLLGYMEDEVTRSEEIKKKMSELKETQNRAYSDMLASSEDYYAQKISKDSAWVSTTENNLNQLLSSLGSGYNVDLTRYKSLESAKMTITNQLLADLGKAWAEYFGMIADGMSLGDIESTMYINGDESMGTNMNYEAYDQAKKIHDVFENLSNSFANVGDKFNGSVNNKSSKSSSYIKSLYQSMVDAILSGGDDLEKAIAITNAKIENAKIIGDTNLEEEQTNKLAELFKQERDNQAKMASELDKQLASMRSDLSKTGMFNGIDLTKLDNLQIDKIINSIDKKLQKTTGNEKTRLEGLKSIIEDVGSVYLDTISKREDLSQAWWEKDNQRRQQEIDNIKRVSEIDKQRHDDKIKQIELEQMYLDENSEEYKAKEQERISLLIDLQRSYQETLSKLKEQNKSEDQEAIREYSNLILDAEIEILNVKKSMAEKERALQIKASQDMVTALEKQKKAIEDRTELVMDMIKKEQELRRKAIEEEIDGYEKIINARKKSITGEQTENKYSEELAEKQKVVSDLESKLLTMQDDNSESSKAKRLKLEEELAKARKDVNKFQLDKITDDRLNALDEELQSFKDEKQEELDEISDYLSKEGQIRSDAMKRIEREGKSMYDSLKKYNSEYGSLAESELEELWKTATTSVNGYIDSNKSLLEIMKDITLEINKQTNLQKTLGTDNWQTFAPTTNTSTTSDNKNLDVITKMMENSNKWKNVSKEEQVKLAEENQKLGKSINAYYDKDTAEWFVDSTKKKKLYSTIGIYHNGGIAGKNMSIGGVSINPNTEIFSKLMIGEPITTQQQASNFITKSLPNLMKAGKNAEINLNISKLIDVAKMDNNTEIEDVMDRAVKEMMKRLNDGLSSIGLRPNLR